MLQEDCKQMVDGLGRPAQLVPGCRAMFQKRSNTLCFTGPYGSLPSSNRFHFPDGDDKRELPSRTSNEAECEIYMRIVGQALGLGYEFDYEDAYYICFVLT